MERDSSSLYIAGHTHRTIHVLKIDCEGCELDVLEAQVFTPMQNKQLKIGQLQAELHLDAKHGSTTYPRLAAFFAAADAAGLRIFHKERNQWGCLGYLVSYFFEM